MRSSWKWYLGLATVLAACAVPAWAQDRNEGQPVSIEVDDAPLREVLKLLSTETGVNVTATPEVAQLTVTLALSEVPLDLALRTLTSMYDLEIESIESQGNKVLLLRRRGARAEGTQLVSRVGGPSSPATSLVGGNTRPPGSRPTAQAAGGLPTQPSGSRPHTAGTGGGPSRRGESVYRQIPIRYELPSNLAAWFNQSGIPTAGSIMQQTYVPRVGVDLGTLRTENGWVPDRQRQSYDSDAMAARIMGRYTDYYRRPEAFGRPLSADVRDQFGDLGGGGIGPGGGGPGGGGGLGGPGGGGPGGGGLGGAGGGAVFELPEGIDELVGFDLTSNLIVRGDPDAIEELRELIAMLDVPPKQIEVEARFVNLTVSEAKALGITWQVSNGSMTVEGSTPSGGGASVAVEYVTGTAQALLTAIDRANVGKVVNAPKVATQNGQPAIVAFQQDIPVTISETITTDAASTVSTEIIAVPVTTALLVVPRVTGAPPNESITTVISPQIEDVIGFVDNPSGGTIPITSTQQIQTMLRIPNGETIALGGLIRKNNSNDSIRIPLLGDLPIIGALFRSKRANVDESELIVFVTPTIIRDATVTEGPVVVR